MSAIIEKLRAMEINFEISLFFDSGFTFKFGDKINGFKETFETYSLIELETILQDRIKPLWEKFCFKEIPFEERYIKWENNARRSS